MEENIIFRSAKKPNNQTGISFSPTQFQITTQNSPNPPKTTAPTLSFGRPFPFCPVFHRATSVDEDSIDTGSDQYLASVPECIRPQPGAKKLLISSETGVGHPPDGHIHSMGNIIVRLPTINRQLLTGGNQWPNFFRKSNPIFRAFFDTCFPHRERWSVYRNVVNGGAVRTLPQEKRKHRWPRIHAHCDKKKDEEGLGVDSPLMQS